MWARVLLRVQWWAGRESNPHSRRRLIYSQRSSPPAQPTHWVERVPDRDCGPGVDPGHAAGDPVAPANDRAACAGGSSVALVVVRAVGGGRDGGSLGNRLEE